MKTLLPFLIVTLFAGYVCAQDSFGPRRTLPQVETTVAADGTQLKCLNVSQWKDVLLITLDYNGLYDWRLKTQGLLKTYDQMQSTYENILKNRDQQIKLLNQHIEYLDLRIKQTVDNAAKMSKFMKVERIAMWVVILGQTVVIIVGGVRGIAN